ncbi:MAG: hypothetical protein OEU26_28090, partial [Candidatus Tectomicrobia bacterium]|nr:hypothetical protein [Candidatus Tectomicrobia bacterium]
MRALYARRLAQSLRDQRQFYGHDWTPEQIRQWQLMQFNAQWQVMCQSVPYFRRLQQQLKLPPQFAAWRQFQDLMPVMDRKTVQEYRDNLTSHSRPSWQWRSTGGSTAEPLRIPVWKSESELASHDLWYGRSWFDITPAHTLFLIWGHSHGLGRGMRGWGNRCKRRLLDTLRGYYRWSAYDVSTPCLHQAAQALLAVQPT